MTEQNGLERSSATDELRRMLDERVVEHYDGTEMTLWLKDEHGYRASANELNSGRLSVHIWCDTPEQAIEATLGRDGYSYGQWREISNAVGDAMEYAHDRAIEHPDAADPLWNLDEYVNRILKVAFEDDATLGRGGCTAKVEVVEFSQTQEMHRFTCSECGELFGAEEHGGLFDIVLNKVELPNYCPNCGRKVRA